MSQSGLNAFSGSKDICGGFGFLISLLIHSGVHKNGISEQ